MTSAGCLRKAARCLLYGAWLGALFSYPASVVGQTRRPTRTPTPTKTLRGGITATPTRTPTGQLPSSPTATPTLPLSPTPAGVSPTATVPLPTATPSATPTPLPFGAPIAFRSSEQLSVGGTLAGISAGNLDPLSTNGEHLDLVVADATGSVRWFQGRGNGTFRPRPNLPIVGKPQAVAVADFTGDNLADIVCASTEPPAVTLFAGRGDGSFAEGVASQFASDPRPLTAIDELVAVVDAVTDRVVLLRADAGSILVEVGSVQVEREPVALAAGDVDGDGLADVAVGHRAGESVLLFRRTGESLSPLSTFRFGAAVAALALDDVNLDGRSDLVMVEETGTVRVLLNNGRSGFAPTFTTTAGPSPVGVFVADDRATGFVVNGDGRPDLLVLNRGANDVSVFHGLGNGRFEHSARLVVGSDPVGFVVGDFANDPAGGADILTANRGDGSVSVVRGSGGGSFVAALSFATGPRPLAAVVTDFDRDGWPDLATLNEEDGSVSFLRGNGRGALRAPVPMAALPTPTSLAAGDFDGDGFTDLAVASAESSRAIRIPNSISGFGLPRPIDLDGPTERLLSVDLNGDGRDDLIGMQRELNRVIFALSDGSSFAAPQTIEIPGTLTGLTVAQVAGDSNRDLVVGTNDPPAVVVFVGGGDVFGPPLRTALPISPDDLAVDDLIVDGRPDIAALSRSGRRIYILAGDGEGRFSRAQDLPAPEGAVGLVTADFNGNGAADLATVVSSTHRVAIFSGTGLGHFQRTDFPVGRNPVALLVANLNVVADPTAGLAELATVNADANTVTVLRNVTRATAPPFTPTPTVGPLTPTPRQPPSPIPTPTRRPRSTGGSGGCSAAGTSGAHHGWWPATVAALLAVLKTARTQRKRPRW